MKLLARYQNALRSIPSPGGGCHPAMLGCANRGVLAGLTAERIFSDLRRSIPRGSRKVADKEIREAIKKAQGACRPLIRLHDGRICRRPALPKPAPALPDGRATLRSIIAQAEKWNETDLADMSPIHVPAEPARQAALFLKAMFADDEKVFIGERTDQGIIGRTIRPVSEWVDHIERGGVIAPFIIVNPLSGSQANKKSGGLTRRGDGNIHIFRHALAEFDNLSHEDQLKFWAAVPLPVVALVDTGGKSLHGWIDVQKIAEVPNHDDWDIHIRSRLYDCRLTPMGCDPACKNPARLSRLPGHFRVEKGKYQRLLWLKGRS